MDPTIITARCSPPLKQRHGGSITQVWKCGGAAWHGREQAATVTMDPKVLTALLLTSLAVTAQHKCGSVGGGLHDVAGMKKPQ